MDAIGRFNNSITKPGWFQKAFVGVLMFYGFIVAWNWLAWPWLMAELIMAIAAPVLILIALRLPRYALLRRRHMRLLAEREKLVSRS
jgi:hypothetical protein